MVKTDRSPGPEPVFTLGSGVDFPIPAGSLSLRPEPLSYTSSLGA